MEQTFVIDWTRELQDVMYLPELDKLVTLAQTTFRRTLNTIRPKIEKLTQLEDPLNTMETYFAEYLGKDSFQVLKPMFKFSSLSCLIVSGDVRLHFSSAPVQLPISAFQDALHH